MDDAPDDDGDATIKGTQKKLIWEYELSRGRWIRYEDAVCRKLNGSVANGGAEFEMDESKLYVDFSTMKQKNLVTGFVRSVRCAVKNAEGDYRVWEYIDSKRRWRSVDPTSAAKLEEAYSDGSGTVKITLMGTNFTACLESSVIRSDDGLAEYEIRSQLSNAEPSMSAKPVPGIEQIRAAKRITSEVDTPTINDKQDVGRQQFAKMAEDVVRTARNSNGKQCSSAKHSSSEKDAELKKQEADNKNDSVDIAVTRTQTEKVMTKSVVAADSECHELRGIAHVYTELGEVYDAVLNQTDAENNSSNYFIMQLLECNTEKRYWVWFRWGSFGCKGETSLNPCDTDLEHAKKLFCDKFKDKTGNDWTKRAHFEKIAGKYNYLPVTTNSRLDSIKVGEVLKNGNNEKLVESKLDSKLQHLLKLICDVRAMEETMMELEYDASKAPLGKVTEEQIKAGYMALKEIENHIKKKDFSTTFVGAVNYYYAKIPHFCGMNEPPLINTTEQLKAEIKLLEALSEIGMAVRIFKKEGEMNIHPIDRHYMNMKCEISIVHAEDPQYKLVEKYFHWTHVPAHVSCNMRIHNLYTVNRNGERERFMFDLGNRKLLWHGSRLTNWYGILSQGLRIAPPEAPVTGYLFGKGIYFADMSTKSVSYCFPQQSKPGLLVLAQVALGEMHELLNTDCNADKLPPGKHSTKGLGSITPDPSTYITLEDGCEVPCGKPITMVAKDKEFALTFNEYIVYDVKQVWIRYLVEVDFIQD